MKLRQSIFIALSLTMLAACGKDYLAPDGRPSANLYYEDGPTLKIFTSVFTNAEKCTGMASLGAQYTKRAPGTRAGPFRIEAESPQTLNIRGINSLSLYAGYVCNPTLTTQFQSNHSYLIKMYERPGECQAAVFDITNNLQTPASSLQAIAVRYRHFTAPFTAASPACDDLS